MAARSKLLVLVDMEMESHPAVQALVDQGHRVHVVEPADIVLSRTAHLFMDDWWNDPKLLETALKRAKAGKK